MTLNYSFLIAILCQENVILLFLFHCYQYAWTVDTSSKTENKGIFFSRLWYVWAVEIFTL